MNEAADRSRKAGMEENMKAVFISNYINHHQIPFSNALYEQLGDDYHFIQTEPMEEERIAMGWGLDAATLPYVVWADREEERCRKLIEEADLVFAGWTKRLDLVLPRLSSGKLTFRVSERIYREGQWKAISPKGLLAKYKEHIRFRNQPVWLLCCGAYVASDFSLIGAYPGKKLKFGYFPETLRCPQEELFAKKNTDKLQIVWAGRMISLKHPEFAVKLAGKLKEQGYSFELHFAGGGPMEEALKQEAAALGVAEKIVFHGFLKPQEVRSLMKRCQLHVFTSNYLEGWGAVVSEAMNSGCCVVANRQIGAVPFLIEDGVNGKSYPDGSYEAFERTVLELCAQPEQITVLGKEAYRTITEKWNAECAAQRCLEFYEGWKAGKLPEWEDGPLSAAPKLSAHWSYNEGTLDGE